MPKNTRVKSRRKTVRPWRMDKSKWTDTLFNRKLLANPSLMTNIELSEALKEHQEWRMASGKYHWEEDPIKENAEDEPPFSPSVLTNIIMESIVRLRLIGDLSIGRFKNHA